MATGSNCSLPETIGGMTRHSLTWSCLLVFLACITLGASPTTDQRGLKIEDKAPAEYVATQAGKAWAIVIGINEYEKVPRLTYAVADAKAITDLLSKQGFQVATLYDKQATRRAILSELDKLKKKVSRQDRVLIFYAGHGDEEKVEGGKEVGYLLPVDGEDNEITATAISMGYVQELAEALPAKHVLFLVDVCYGGIAGLKFRSPSTQTEDYLRTITRERGRQLITAGGADQKAAEGPKWRHSVFTYYLLEGLGKGDADLNNDGIIPASELYTYLERRVFDAAKLNGHEQRPEIYSLSAEKGEFVFVPGKRVASGAKAAADSMPAPNTALAQAEQELKTLEDQVRQAEEQQKLAAVRQQIEQKKRQIEDKEKKVIEEARVRPFEAPQQLTKEITGKDGAPMALVPAGEFLYGFDNQRMSLPAFYMDLYEVTTSRYATFLQATSHSQPKFWEDVRPASDGDLPVVGMDAADAKAYCRWAGKRLPTSQEWEKAARGVDGRTYPWGNNVPTASLANYGPAFCGPFCNVYEEKLKPVNSYPQGRSPYGIYNMAGNAYEWVEEEVVRGGSWLDGPLVIRSANWFKYTANIYTSRMGFRCAQDAR